MIGRLRQLSEPRLRWQAGIEKSQTPVERDIPVQWVRKGLFEITEVEITRVDCMYIHIHANFISEAKIKVLFIIQNRCFFFRMCHTAQQFVHRQYGVHIF